ncbi:MAG: type II toxin-antitoxin system Phd/YefM family antitoxin [Anaerovoracaceae bacterium]|nr:type II toxin-antitoxin system Phd/YefM family antitoxin [Clostridiales bacterium]
MPKIKSSTDLRNNYNEISKFCNESKEPVFITKNGQGDLAVMSIDTYEMLNGKLELYRLLDEGRTAVKEDRKLPMNDVVKDLLREINNE